MGIAGPFGLPFFPLCDSIQEGEGHFRGDLLQVLSPEFLTDFGKNQFVCPDSVFFRMTLMIFQPKFCCL